MRQFNINPFQPDKNTLAGIADIVRQGGTLVYPTETIYGVGGNALNQQTIEAVYALKGRDARKPLSVIIPSVAWVERLAAKITPAAYSLMQSFWPGPLTIVFRAAAGVPAALTAHSGTIAVRVSSMPFCTALALAANCPLIATSANLAGGANCSSIQNMPPEILENTDAVVDGGILPAAAASTVVDATGSEVKILRAGAVDSSRIKAAVAGKEKHGT